MTQPEAKLSRKIMASLRLHGYFCFKVHGSEYMMAGLPDIIVCAQGLFIGIETKMPSERDDVSARQHYVHGLIRDAEGTCQVACSPTEALQVVGEALEKWGKSPG